MSPLNVAQGHLYGTMFEIGLYGIYLVLFVMCVCIFVTRKHDHTRNNKIILVTICLMFALSTAHLGGTMQSLQAAFFDSRPATPESYFNNKALPLNIYNKSVYAVSIVLGDALLIYRLYVIYQGNLWVITPPIILLLGTTASLIMIVYEFSKLKPGQTAFAESIKRLTPAIFGLPLATNLLITFLIVFRVWQAERRIREAVERADVSIYRAIIANTIESCIMYPLALIVSLVLNEINNHGQDVITGPMTQIISIVPTLMWMQVRLGFSRYEAAFSSTAMTTFNAASPVAVNLGLQPQHKRNGSSENSAVGGSSTVSFRDREVTKEHDQVTV